jgi:hypothetical protein
MTRGISIIFYILIAVATCVMADAVDNHNTCIYVNGYPTRRHCMNKLMMSGIFVILFAVSALRFDIGNDYYTYTQTAHEASVGGYVVTEVGFNYLVRMVYTVLNGEYYEVVFAIFAFVTLMIFLKGMACHTMANQGVSFFDTFFLFMMMGMYFQTFNTVRYYLALSIAFYSMRYVLEKDYIKFVFVILIAALFHKSVLIVIPVYLIATCKWKRWQIVAGFIVSGLCYVFKTQLLNLALILYPSYKDTIYLEGGTSIISMVRIFAVLLLYGWFVVYYSKGDDDREIRFYGQLNMVAFVTGTFFSFLPVITRLVYYFSISQILIIPLIVSRIKDERLRKKLKIFIGMVAILYFLTFLLTAHKDGVGLLPYKSWLFQTERYTF